MQHPCFGLDASPAYSMHGHLCLTGQLCCSVVCYFSTMFASLCFRFDERVQPLYTYCGELIRHHILIPQSLRFLMSASSPQPESLFHRDVESEIKLQLLAVQFKDNAGRLDLLERLSRCKARFENDPWLHDAHSQRMVVINTLDPVALKTHLDKVLAALKKDEPNVDSHEVCLSRRKLGGD